jgi:tripartite-type tricarboxylate transporter receptor subunit TctC
MVLRGAQVLTMNSMKMPGLAAALAAALLGIGSAAAQPFPSHPITMTVPFPAGGSVDAVGRIVAEGMRSALGQAVIVENVSGAAGSIGVGRVARAAPDGYTLSMGQWGTHVVNAAIYPLAYDVLNDFAPLALVASNPYLVLTRNALPANDLQGLIAWLRASPGTALLGIPGVGSPAHIGGLFFEKTTGTRLQFVPYRGGSAAMQDLLAGQIDMMFDSPANSLAQVRAGMVKVHAVTAARRLATAPDIPTANEAGLPGFYFSSWTALWAPKGTPKDAIASLNAAVVSALADPTVRKRLADLGQDIPPREEQTPQALGALQKAEIEKWWPIIKAAGIKAE